MTESTSPAAAFTALGIDPPLAQALESRGFTELTPVQVALIDPALSGRDVLVSAQTGSGKTVAFGLLVAPSLEGEAPKTAKGSAPRAIVITPTRELANQVREELGWLLESRGLRVVAVTGGTSIMGERRELARGADIVVGTPGRLNDHLSRHAIDGSHVQTLVLDEADEMLDMGFRDELEAILQAVSSERRTVMLSATLPREIEDLARTYMRSPARIAIDRPGASNENISFVAHLVPPANKVDALINLLLGAPDERTMIFVRTRADATDTASQLVQLGFLAAALQGEMGQRERTATLDAFRAGRVQALVATDVAARGIDVPEVTQVIHADLPGDPSALTHRSGRTGRAGRRGTSVLLVPSFARRRAEALLRAAGARATWGPVPGVAEIERAAAERTVARLTDEARTPADTERGLAKKLLESRDAEELVAILLEESRWRGATAPRDIKRARDERFERDDRRGRDDRGGDRAGDRGAASPRPRAEREPGSYSMYRVNYGANDGATAARLLAMLCRRGNVRGSDIGAISVGGDDSTFGVKHAAAATFGEAAMQRDVRDPHIFIEPLEGGAAPAPRAPREPSHRKGDRPQAARRAREDERADVFAAELEGGVEPAWKKREAPAPREREAASTEAPRRSKRGFDRDEAPAVEASETPAAAPRTAWAKRERPAVAATNPADDDWVTTDASAPSRRDEGASEKPSRPAKPGGWKSRDAGAPPWARAEGATKPAWKKRDASGEARPAWKKRDDAGATKPAWKKRDDAAASTEARPAWKKRDEAGAPRPAWKKRDDAGGSTEARPAWKKRDDAGGSTEARPAWKKRDGERSFERAPRSGTKPAWGARDASRGSSAPSTGGTARRADATPRGAGGAQGWRATEESGSPRDRARAKRAAKKR